MKIATDMFNHYVDYFTGVWTAMHDLPPDSLSEYDEEIALAHVELVQRNDLEPFRLAIDWILLHPEKYSLQHHGGTYPFDDEEVRVILRYLREKIYPGQAAPSMSEVKDVELVPQSRFDWWDQRERDGLFDRSRVATNGPAEWVEEWHQAVREGREPKLPDWAL